jgi:hypothetical protein
VIVAKAAQQESIAIAVSCDDLRSAVADAKRQTEGEARKASTDYDVGVVFHSVAKAGGLYSNVLEIYADWLNDPKLKAIPRGKVVGGARDAIEQSLKKQGEENLNELNTRLLRDVKPTLMRLGKNPDVPAKTFDSLMELWKSYLDMKDCSDAPRGDADEYLGKTMEMRQQHKKLIEALKVQLSVDDDD